MKIQRHFTTAGKDVYASVEWTKRTSRITNPDGSVVFEMTDVEVPKSWSQLATDIMVSKYFRKAGVPRGKGPRETGPGPRGEDGPDARPTGEEGGQSPFSQSRKGGQTPRACEAAEDGRDARPTGPETSVKQVVHRLAGCWRYWGEKHNYFDTPEDGQAFYDEIAYMLLHQMAAPNSPQWFNTGLNWAYGLKGPAQGHWYVDPQTGQTKQAEDAYTHPQPHACFIQSIKDDLVGPGGIMDLWTREARLFKYGSGTGTNFSRLRGENEPLSGGGKSSGLMSFLKIGDRAAGAIKSGGTTRRAAKMVCLDLDHPDIEAFVTWKVREEIKVAAMVEGFKRLPEEHKRLAQELGLKLDYDFNGEAYQTVSGQNANNSIRISNDFFKALDEDGDWKLVRRTDGKVAKTLKARKLWDQIAFAAWRCADPGVQFDTTINQWHTCPASGRINASNPCSEYMFLDDTACNLASLNLLKFYNHRKGDFDLPGFEHAVRLWTIVLEISVLMAAFPSQEIARLSYEFRTLGLGHANIGAMLMQAGIAYDSPRARAIAAAITAIMTGRAYATSAQMAAQLGPFPGYFKNRGPMLRVIRNHRRAAYGVPRQATEAMAHELGDYEELDIRPVALEAGDLLGEGMNLKNAEAVLTAARKAWDDALALGERHGYRNAQTTVIAPTGTIGLLMDCDTTGVEPDFALVKFKKLAGGGYFKIANQSLRPALETLGYDERQVREILTYVMGTMSLDVPLPDAKGRVSPQSPSFRGWLREKGLTEEELGRVNDGLMGAMDASFAFNAATLGEEAMERLGLAGKSDVLRALGLTRAQIEKINELICGTGTVEGAPHLKEEHLPVFDCANRCGRKGRRFIAPQGHIRMMAATQPFITGAISKTINLPNQATVEDIKAAYRLSWELGLKANALYRDGCKLSQPLNVAADSEAEEADAQEEPGLGKEEASGEQAVSAETRGQGPGTRDKGQRRKDDEPIALPTEEDKTAASRSRLVPDQAGGSEGARAVEKIVERVVEQPRRRRLPDTRRSITHKFSVGGHEGYLTVGLYEDGRPGELFITMAKEGSTVGGLMDSLGTAISVALQYGVPIESLVNKFTHQRFEPSGMTHNPDIPFAKSLVDYIFRWMGMQFIAGYRAANAPQRSIPKDAPIEKGPGGSAEKGEGGLETDSRVKVEHTGGGYRGHGHEGGSVRGNGNGNGHEAEASAPRETALTAAMREMQADAPACDVCGTITVRSGTCYKCLNCGHSMGCS